MTQLKVLMQTSVDLQAGIEQGNLDFHNILAQLLHPLNHLHQFQLLSFHHLCCR